MKIISIVILFSVELHAVTVDVSTGFGYHLNITKKTDYFALPIDLGVIFNIYNKSYLDIRMEMLIIDKWPGGFIDQKYLMISQNFKLGYRLYLSNNVPSIISKKTIFPYINFFYNNFITNYNASYYPGIEINIGLDILFPKNTIIEGSSVGLISSFIKSRFIMSLSCWISYYFDGNLGSINSGVRISLGTLF